MLDYSAVTEERGMLASPEQVARLYQRYQLARDVATGGRILEVACGHGLGLTYLSAAAESVIGLDLMSSFLAAARQCTRESASLVRADAQRLPFRDGRMDLMLCFEALYYFDSLAMFFAEARRVLRQRGQLLISSVNPHWSGFLSSSFHKQQFTLQSLKATAERMGLSPACCWGGFPVSDERLFRATVGQLRRLAAAIGIVPESLRGRMFLKRLFYGRLVQIPDALGESPIVNDPIVPMTFQNVTDFKIMYVLFRKT